LLLSIRLRRCNVIITHSLYQSAPFRELLKRPTSKYSHDKANYTTYKEPGEITQRLILCDRRNHHKGGTRKA
jgi:hypothetical protein